MSLSMVAVWTCDGCSQDVTQPLGAPGEDVDLHAPDGWYGRDSKGKQLDYCDKCCKALRSKFAGAQA